MESSCGSRITVKSPSSVIWTSFGRSTLPDFKMSLKNEDDLDSTPRWTVNLVAARPTFMMTMSSYMVLRVRVSFENTT